MLLIKNKSLRKLYGFFETFNLLFIKLFLRNRSKASVFPGEIFRCYMSLVGKDKWCCRDIFDIFSAPETACVIIVEHLPVGDKGLPLHELASLALLTKVVKPHTIFEIGTYSGRTALNFAQNCPEKCRVYTLDLPKNTAYPPCMGVDYKGKEIESKIEELFHDGSVFDYSPYFGKIDVVFVNGLHDYESVRSDTVNALKMVKLHGYVVWHDFANYGETNGVTRVIFEMLPSDQVIQIATTQLAFYVKTEVEDCCGK